MKDRFVNGFIAGFAGAVTMNIFNLIGFYLHTVKDRYFDFAAVLLWYKTAGTTGEIIASAFVQLFFTALLGTIFAYLTPYLKKQYFLFKGASFGLSWWFAFYALTTLLKLPAVGEHTLAGSTTNGIGSAIYGIVLAYIFGLLDNKDELENAEEKKNVPTKYRIIPIPSRKIK